MKRRLRKILSDNIPCEDLPNIHNSYDVVGDIAVIRLTKASSKYNQAIAGAILEVHKSIKTVLAQTGPVHGAFRLRRLEQVAGENKTTTIHKESGCLFNVDIEKCYFSPRLFHERMRIAKLVKTGEVVVNMFAGVGCFSIIIATCSHAKKVYSIDVNPAAVRHMQENVRINRVYGKVFPMFGDAKEIIEKKLRRVAGRVLMPLPEKALEYFPYALLALKEAGGWIHYYDFEHARKKENPIEKVKLKATKKLESLNAKFEIPLGRVVRKTGPNWHQIALDINVRPT
ncbi:MAG: class I SAM-dependent methyltransferase family protein [Candidatus Bathyarchaeota archaeon]|nr:class I SAM-dependent methyltransferase family protein [Candidatus Bathyarchaeota archaeon]MDH5787257.1 class I SAM-dependent methyltransferase family protein [Candidatus Bathyarchaeota archaeon]